MKIWWDLDFKKRRWNLKLREKQLSKGKKKEEREEMGKKKAESGTTVTGTRSSSRVKKVPQRLIDGIYFIFYFFHV